MTKQKKKFIDYKEALKRADMALLLVSMGFDDLDESKDTYVGLCRFHNDNKTKSFSADLVNGLFHCFGCGVGGDSINLYAIWKGIDYRSAAIELLEKPIIRNVKLMEIRIGAITTTKRLDLYKVFINALDDYNDHAKYLHSRCISRNSLDEMGVKFLPKDMDKLRKTLLGYEEEKLWREVGIINQYGGFAFPNHPIVFPFYMDYAKKSPVSFQVRCVDDKGDILVRYLGPKINGGVMPCFINHRVMYKAKRLFVCEGPTDALSMIEIGENNVVATPGAGSLQLNWFDDFKGKQIIFCLDNDNAGDLAYKRYSEELRQKGFEIGRFILKEKDINKTLCKNRSIIL